MVEKPLTRVRGGFMRPFGAAVFILDFLAGRGPDYGVEAINPQRGSPQADIHAQYKMALHRAWADDAVATYQERRIREGKSALMVDEADQLLAYYQALIPYKQSKMRYHSFVVYFRLLRELGWVEATPNGEEPSVLQSYYPPAPPRRYYRLTARGARADPGLVSDPLQAVYNYPPEIRSPKRPRPRLPEFMRAPVPAPTVIPPEVKEVRPPPPPAPEEEEVPEAVQERWNTLAERIRGWARPRATDAERLLKGFAEEMGKARIELTGLDEALDLLQEYRDLAREDFDTSEEYSEARTDAWQEFLDALDEVELAPA